MNGHALLPLAVLASERRERRRELANQLLPAMLPLASGPRVAVSTVTAQESVRRAETRTGQVAEEAITAATEAAEKPLSETDLLRFPHLATVLQRRPDLRARLLEPPAQEPPPPDSEIGAAILEVASIVAKDGAAQLNFDLGKLQQLKPYLSEQQREQLKNLRTRPQA